MRTIAPSLVSPIACLALLGGMALENSRHAQPADAAPYHREAGAMIAAWPSTIRSPDDEWVSRDEALPTAAVQLLNANAVLCRHYFSTVNGAEQATLLIVQCRQTSDMSGHYPPNCYPNNGEPLSFERPRVWQVDGTTVRGMEYHFEPKVLGEPGKCVYNFFVLPGRGIVPDMLDVRKASADYQRRYFGAAQFQLLFRTDLPEATRDQMFQSIVGAEPDIFRALNPPGI